MFSQSNKTVIVCLVLMVVYTVISFTHTKPLPRYCNVCTDIQTKQTQQEEEIIRNQHHLEQSIRDIRVLIKTISQDNATESSDIAHMFEDYIETLTYQSINNIGSRSLIDASM
ncbi:hypothetical protein AKO1_008095 [Acrasis kona]|uniref:Uncharacterized protein n=1 Tax=Acrasis kona TaxID=1008807 RepID=A0AAW2YQ88_9EUKA